MTDRHDYSFFGQNVGVILNSEKTNLFIYMKFIKRTASGVWEKPSAGEGKSIKLSTEECISILEVLNKRALKWSAFHSFEQSKTQISFSWEDKSASKFWINVDSYSKMLNLSQTEFFRRLLEHIVDEQITFGTVSKQKPKNEY